MKDQKLSKSDILSLGFLSFFGTGYFPFAPGTMGSLATIPLIYILSSANISFALLIIIIVVLTLLASVVADKVQKKRGVQDPGWIVIDEVIGMLVTWAFIFPEITTKSIIAVFCIFRVFDIIKIFPANYCDKKIKSGFGTIVDDVISGIYAGLVILIIQNFTSLLK